MVKKLKIEIIELKSKLKIDQENGGLKDDEIERLKKKNENLEKKIALLTGGTGKGGLDKPRCKVNGHEMKYIAKFGKSSNGFSVQWLENLSEEKYLDAVTGLRQLVSKNTLSQNQFKKYALKVYNWGESQNPKCRFYVRLDRTGLTIDEIDLIDSHFYKLNVK